MALIASGCVPCRDDPTEHINLKDTMPALFESMRLKLLAHGRTLYQTAYAEPGTTDKETNCLTGAEARALYVGHNTCVQGSAGYNPSLPGCDEAAPKYYLGPMCFKDGEKPHVPPPPPPPPGFTICKDSGCTRCLTTNGSTWAAMVLGHCTAAAEKSWSTANTQTHAGPPQIWAQWLPTFAFIKVDERSGNASCAVGDVFVNPDEPRQGRTSQGFTIVNASSSSLPAGGGGGGGQGLVRFHSTACAGLCLADDGESGVRLAPCNSDRLHVLWTVKEWGQQA